MRGLDLARQIPTGIVHINDQTVDDAPNTPFGGIGASGTGARFGGTANLDAFTDTRWVTDAQRDRALPVLDAVRTPTRTRTQIGIVGAGPAGLLLSHLLALRGIDSVLVERPQPGLLRGPAAGRACWRTAASRLLREAGLAERLDREGLEHGGIYLQFAGQRQHIDFRDLTGRTVTVYAQTEVVKDLIAARLAAGGQRASSR